MEDIVSCWSVVYDGNNQVLINGENIVLQKKGTSEIGYIENTEENAKLFGITTVTSVYSCEVPSTSQSYTQNVDNEAQENEAGQFQANYSIDQIETDIHERMDLDEGNINDGDDDDDEMVDRWNSNKVQYLLSLYLERKAKFRNPKIKKKILWKEISDKLKVSETACDKKFRNMKGTYIKLLNNKKKSGRGAISWKYFNIFEEIFQKDRNIHPSIKRIDSLKSVCPQQMDSATTSATAIKPFSKTRENTLFSGNILDNRELIKPPDGTPNLEYQPQLDATPANSRPPSPAREPARTPVTAANTRTSTSGPAGTVLRERRFEAYRKLTKEIRDRQVVLEKKLDDLTEVLKESNNIQRQRNDYLKAFLEKRK